MTRGLGLEKQIPPLRCGMTTKKGGFGLQLERGSSGRVGEADSSAVLRNDNQEGRDRLAAGAWFGTARVGEADSSAALRNDNQEGRDRLAVGAWFGRLGLVKQIPPLRCGMTTKKGGIGLQSERGSGGGGFGF